MSITITNTLATITNGTNIYLQQQITTTSNIINTINQTAISSMPIDGWVIFGASISVGDIATVVSAIFMVVTVLEMKKQRKNEHINYLYQIFIEIDKLYNDALFEILKIRNQTDAMVHTEKCLPYYFQLLTQLNLACRIYYSESNKIQQQITSKFGTMFKDNIEIFMINQGLGCLYDTKKIAEISEYQYLQIYYKPINTKELVQYCENNKIEIVEISLEEVENRGKTYRL